MLQNLTLSWLDISHTSETFYVYSVGSGHSPGGQWLRIVLPVQGAWVQTPVGELDPTRHNKDCGSRVPQLRPGAAK